MKNTYTSLFLVLIATVLLFGLGFSTLKALSPDAQARVTMQKTAIQKTAIQKQRARLKTPNTGYGTIFTPLTKVSLPKDKNQLKKIELGKKLFFEKQLSLAKDISCNSCHSLSSYGVDNNPVSPGHKGQLGVRNSPSVFNASLHISQFWDGRAKDVEEQALGPIMNSVEMASVSEKETVKRIKNIQGYQTLFTQAFPISNPAINFKNIGNAIGAFERVLITRGRFDSFLEGDTKAINDKEKKGLKTFVEVGCASCHSGSLLGGGMYQKLGLVKKYPTKDKGRFEVTKQEHDSYLFKVPSLRNITKTSPYLHDGSVKSLKVMVDRMAVFQLGKVLSRKENSEIRDFLNTLEGSLEPDVQKLISNNS